MLDIKLKNKNGEVVTYENVTQIKAKDAEGNNVIFTAPLGQQTSFYVEGVGLWESQNHKDGVKTHIPEEPTKAGHWFKGWSENGYEYHAADKVLLPQVFSGDKALYAMFIETPEATATADGLGSTQTTDISFSVDENFPTTFEEVTDNYNNVFIKIPTIYRKIIEIVDGQITAIQLSTTKIDETYKPYPCFVKEDGVTVMPYILIGKYCMSDTQTAKSVNATAVNMTISAGRNLARARGTGYQLYDWQMQRLFQDLVILNKKSVNVNVNNLLGISHLDSNIWVDGFCQNSGMWICSYKPSKYIDNPANNSDGYVEVGYTSPTVNGQCIKKLGYDEDNPFFNYPAGVVNDSSYNSYYYDAFYYSSGNHPVVSYVANSGADYGLFATVAVVAWTTALRVRLCYRPI